MPVSYEHRFVTLFDELPLQQGTDRRLLRLMLLGALNWAQLWYRPDRTSIEDIAQTFVDNLRLPLSHAESGAEVSDDR